MWWHDSCGAPTSVSDDCCGSGCVDGGGCNTPDPQSYMDCNGDDVWWFDDCGAPTSVSESCPDSGGCAQGACYAGCPPDMVSTTVPNLCVDRFEASMKPNGDCTGASYGLNNDDYPAGFGDYVISAGYSGTEVIAGYTLTLVQPTVDVYACSIPNVPPSRFMTYMQAKRACENAGKRICTHGEWQDACRGPASLTYPYGDTYNDTSCNTSDAGPGTTWPTGSSPACEGGYAGLQDMSGNVVEWTLCSDSICLRSGGAWQYPGGSASCTFQSGQFPEASYAVEGVRCCLDI